MHELHHAKTVYKICMSRVMLKLFTKICMSRVMLKPNSHGATISKVPTVMECVEMVTPWQYWWTIGPLHWTETLFQSAKAQGI